MFDPRFDPRFESGFEKLDATMARSFLVEGGDRDHPDRPLPLIFPLFVNPLAPGPAIPNSERVYAISADQGSPKRLDLNETSRVPASKNFEFGIVARPMHQPPSLKPMLPKILASAFRPAPIKAG